MSLGQDLLGVVHVLALAYVGVEVVLLLGRLVTRAINQSGN